MPFIETYQQTPAQHVKKATEVLHQEVENLLIPMLTNIRSYKDYGKILYIFHGFFTPLEKRIGQFISIDILRDYNERRKSGWIEKDLQNLSLNLSCRESNHLPKITNTAEAFGALYVLEGSTLGGRYITKMLMKNKHIDLSNAVHFFNGYDEETGSKWKAFLESLNHYAEVNNCTEDITAAANETFLNLKHWINDNDQKQ